MLNSNNLKNNKNIIKRRDFLKLGVAPFLFFKDDNKIKAKLTIVPKSYFLEHLKLDVVQYKISQNIDREHSFKVEIDTTDIIPIDHCNYSIYSELYIEDIENKKSIHINNIYFDWGNIRVGNNWSHQYNYGQFCSIYDNLIV